MSHLYRIAMIDNDDYFLSKWKQVLGRDAVFTGYRDFSSFLEEIDSGRISMNEFDFIIVDFEFGYTNAGKKDFGNFLSKEMNFSGTKIMCSLHSYFGEYDELIKNSFDHVVDKVPMRLDELLKLGKVEK